jgi:hypothetical protein
VAFVSDATRQYCADVDVGKGEAGGDALIRQLEFRLLRDVEDEELLVDYSLYCE